MFLCLRSSLRSKLALGVDSVTRNYVYALFVFAWPWSWEYPPPEKQWQSFNFYRYGSETVAIVGNPLDVRFSTQMLKRNYHKMKSKKYQVFWSYAILMTFFIVFPQCKSSARIFQTQLQCEKLCQNRMSLIRESSLYGIQNFSCVHITWSYNDIFCYCQTPLFSNQGIREFPLGFPFSLMFVIYQ